MQDFYHQEQSALSVSAKRWVHGRQRGIDFPSFLQLMPGSRRAPFFAALSLSLGKSQNPRQWMVDCNFGDINSAAERALNR